MKGLQAQPIPKIAPPKTPAAVRHASYPVEAQRVKPLSSPSRDYGKQTKAPPMPNPTQTGFGTMGLPPGGGL